MARVATVNVVETIRGRLVAVSSFTNDGPGQTEANEHFRKCGRERGLGEEEIESGLEWNGFVETCDGYALSYITSEK